MRLSAVRHHPVTRYGVAVGATAVALGLTLVSWRTTDMRSQALLFAAVVVSAWVGGLGPGILATLLAALAGADIVHRPYLSFDLMLDDTVRLLLFVSVALIIASLTEARRRAEGLHAQLLIREKAARAKAETMEKRYALLAEATRILAAGSDLDAALARVARLVVPQMADACIVDVAEPDGGVRRVAVAHVGPTGAEPRAETLRYPLPRGGHRPAERLPGGARAQLYTAVDETLLTALAHDADHLRLLKELRLRAALIVPLAVQDRTLGVMWFGAVNPDARYGLPEQSHAEQLARVVALAVAAGAGR